MENLGNRRGLWWISLSFLFFHNNWCSWGCSVSFVAELMTFEVKQHCVLLFYNFKKASEGNNILMYWNIIIPTATRSFYWNKIEINEMKWNAMSFCDRWNGIDPWRTEISLDRVVPWEDWEFLPDHCVLGVLVRKCSGLQKMGFPMLSQCPVDSWCSDTPLLAWTKA